MKLSSSLRSRLTARGILSILVTMLFCAGFLVASGTSASGQCAMGFTSSATTPTIDGTRGGDWIDASILRTGDPCVTANLMDWNGTSMMGTHADPQTARNVTVLSKRVGANFYIAFEVEDETRTGVSAERIILLFDPAPPGGAQLNGDFRLEASHDWTNAGGVLTLSPTFFNTGTSISCDTSPEWAATGMPTGVAVAATLTGTAGYFMEFRIPLAAINNPTGDIGIAFAVINDLGNCVGTTCDASAATFPSSATTASGSPWVTSNSLDPLECFGRTPSDWKLGYVAGAPTDVTIDRTPVWWSADSINVKECTSTSTTSYTYHELHPCKIIIEAQLRNTGPATQRNILFVWGKNGTSPSNWVFVDLLKNVPIVSGTGTMGGILTSFFPIPLWAGVPVDEDNHPCVRVFVLPPAFRADFTETQIRQIDTEAELADMVSKYQLNDSHTAQKNISRLGGSSCTPTSCQVAQNIIPDRPDRADLPQGDVSFVMAGMRASYPSNAAAGTNVTVARMGAAVPQDKPPIIKPGTDILMSGTEKRRLGAENVIVQFRSVGFSHATRGAPPRYNIIEELGGVIHLFPVEMLKRGQEVPFKFNVTNPGRVARTIFVRVDLLTSSGFEDVTIALNVGPMEFAENETKTVSGIVSRPGTPPPHPGFRRWGLSLHAGTSFPHGDFNTFFNPGGNFGVDLEYRINSNFSLEAIYTFHHFRGETLFGFPIGDLNVHQFSVNGKVYGSSSPVRPFFNFGGGAYKFDPGSTRGGLNIGGGVQFDVTPNIAIDTMYNFHNVFTSGSSTRFSTLQGGVRFRF